MEHPKGSLHLLWECGFIDPDKYYTKEGKDEHGRVILERSLKYLIRQCCDFEHEQTLLQHISSLLGVIVDRTPKCHCEMAGEGIEYSWGLGKNAYRRFPMADKKSKEKFRAGVQKCMSRDYITTKRVGMFSRRARRYMVAYYLLSTVGDSIFDDATSKFIAQINADKGSCNKATPIKIEKLVKMQKNHRCAWDFDTGFICEVEEREDD
jgi:hypothetical protein